VQIATLRFKMQWAGRRIDPLELVTLREAGLSLGEIAARLGFSRTGVFRALKVRGIG
jgi:DNA-binding IclR family transcriptional regulator